METEDVTFQLLEEITHGFSEDRKLGEGSFGVVYRGTTKNGEDVAVKMLRDTLTDPDQNKQFQNELNNLKKLKHQNIVRLFGYCYQIEHIPMESTKGIQVLVEKTHRAICLEYLHKGNLQNHLSDEFSGLDWNTRFNIMKGTCQGLKHMHEEQQEPIYHFDLKPANILLDENMVPKIADLGLSKIFHNKELTGTTECPLGTCGYQPPEYVERGEISKKFDTFSLGVVMIKILSGPKGYEKYRKMPSEDEFVDQVKKHWRDRLQKTWSGSSLEAYCRQVETCIQIALDCVETDTEKRPDIVMVINKLNGIEIDSGKHLQDMTVHDNMKMQMEPDNTTDKKQYLNLMRSSSCDGAEFVDVRENSLDVGGEFIVGRKEEKKKIMTSLHLNMSRKITILPIYGIGGIGKTTFAKLIYNDEKFNDYSRVWIYVSPRFDLNKVGNSIISQLSGEKSHIDEIEMIHSSLVKLLSGKKVLIVLDDLWEDNPFELNDLKDMLNPGGNINIIVLVTTRSKHVAHNVTTNVQPHGIEPLTNDMCWEIIKQRSGFNFEVRNGKQFMDIGREIALKCGGMALAARSIGFMLKPLKLINQWMEVKDSEIWNESISDDVSLPNNVLASLKLSCSRMAPCLMSCFSYCAIFPKGHRIIKEDLIYQWISLGFIKPSKLRSYMQVGDKYIGQLLGLSFLQMPPMDTSSQAYKKGLTVFTMHHLVHDLARLLVIDKFLDASNAGVWDYRYLWHTGCFFKMLTDCFWPKILDASSTQGQGYRYVWLPDFRKPLKSLMDSPITIRALHIGNCCNEIRKDYAFSPAKFLQVLDLSGCDYLYDLPDSIGELVHLRYLNAQKLPSRSLVLNSLTKMSELIYLNLSGSDFSVIQTTTKMSKTSEMICCHLNEYRFNGLLNSISKIKSLVHLDISECNYVCLLPESFANLENLVYLDLSSCGMDITGKVLGGLSINIQHLNLSHNCISDAFKELQEVISRLTELQFLGLSGCLWQDVDGVGHSVQENFFDHVCTLPNLVHLDLSGSRGLVRVPESIGSLRKLHTLNLSGCYNLETLPECMLKMDCLKVVNVTGCSSLDGSTLPRSMRATGLPYFEVVHDADGESGSNIGLLRHVNPTELRISKLDNTMSAEEIQSIKLSEKDGMISLSFEWTRDAPRSVEDMEVLGELVPPKTLRFFRLRGYHSMSFPAWVMDIACYLPCLTKVVLWELRKCNTLPPLGQLPSLQELIMGRMDSITKIEEGFYDGRHMAFTELKKFHLCHMENLEVWNTTYSYGQDDDVQQHFMFPNLRKLLIHDCPKLRLKPCPPRTETWEIENSDNVLSSWGYEDREIDLIALLSSNIERKINFGQVEIQVPAAWRPLWEKFSKPGASYNACPKKLEVRSSNVPLEQWRLFHHLLPTYDLTITCCPYLTSSSQEIIREITYIKSLSLEGDAQSDELPKWLDQLTLNTLYISEYSRLEAPLETTTMQLCLRRLRLHNCGRISTLPQWLGELIFLRILMIIHCTSLSDFPESMRRLTSLQVLYLQECSRITALPEWLGDLTLLEQLVINNCVGIESLPGSIQKLTGLKKLSIRGPGKLVRWCELEENKEKLAHIYKDINSEDSEDI